MRPADDRSPFITPLSPSAPLRPTSHLLASCCPPAQRGYSVWGSYLSPVHDSYGKPGLAASCHRLAMSEAAAAASPSVMVDSWEARQAGYTRTLQAGSLLCLCPGPCTLSVFASLSSTDPPL